MTAVRKTPWSVAEVATLALGALLLLGYLIVPLALFMSGAISFATALVIVLGVPCLTTIIRRVLDPRLTVEE